ncbi:MAG: 1-acyl-sn-glycerol-3-phosphate acyltransferase [Bifidobacteriaceae bacterium]|nr:1-acyl-sn-glycerol-3-phosphate acyltransferase [Bifidobacteriaceae bacterium]
MARALVAVYLSARVTGRNNVPRRGPVILAANHLSFLDGPLVLAVAPRGVFFLIKEALARGAGGKILLAAGQIPIYHGHGHEALEAALGELRLGRAVGIFPEGTRRTGHVGRIHAGVAWLAVRSGAPVIPVACLGTRHEGDGVNRFPGFRRRVAVVFGRPVDLAAPLALAAGTGGPAAGDARHREHAAISQAMDLIGEALHAHVEAAAAMTGIPLPDTGGTLPEAGATPPAP